MALAATVLASAPAHARQAPAPVVHVGPATDDVDVSLARTAFLTVPDGGTIRDVDVAVTLAGGVGYAREIELSLSHLGVTVVLHRAVENPTNPPYVGGAIDAVFDDEAIATIGQPPTPRTGTADIFIPVVGAVIPAESLSAFDGMDAAGVWTLSMRDPGVWQNDGEDLASWSITLEAEEDQIVVWGDQLNPVALDKPSGGGFVALDTTQWDGSLACWALREDGSIAAWGGQYPNGFPASSANLVSNTPSESGFTALSIGDRRGLALRADGSIVQWGDGNNLFYQYLDPEPPTGVGYTAIAAGDPSSHYALDASGAIRAWGRLHDDPVGTVAGFGEVFDPQYYAPVPLGTGFKAISAGSFDPVAVALSADGSIEVFGYAASWAIGQVELWNNAPTGNGYVALAHGHSWCVALHGDGSLHAWGDYRDGRLDVPPGNDFVAIAAGAAVGLALRSDGSLAAWGDDSYGVVSGIPTEGRFSAIACSEHSLYGVALRAPSDSRPVADAGADFSVDEGTLAVTLDGSASSDPDNDPLTFAWSQVGGAGVTLNGDSTAGPTFDAPLVALGGETLTFQLTVTGNGVAAIDSVSVTVVNLNHPPVADAGADQALAEGSPVTLSGEGSFDLDLDALSYSWVQVSGPAVTLQAATTVNPTFVAPYYGSGGAPGVVAELEFELTVDDGNPAEVPAPGYTFANVRDTVTISVLNVNSDPVAEAGPSQTSNENVEVVLGGAQSSDPDNDTLTFTWIQTGGPTVVLAGAATVAPSFMTPFVGVGGADLTFQLTVDDGNGGLDGDTVVVHVQNVNDPPNAGAARPSQELLWPPNHQMVSISILGVSDPNDNATITIDQVLQDEPTAGTGSGDTPIDAVICAGGTVLLRAERDGSGDGRVYRIHFTASDLEGSSAGVVTVTVPHSKRGTAVESGMTFDSTR